MIQQSSSLGNTNDAANVSENNHTNVLRNALNSTSISYKISYLVVAIAIIAIATTR